MRPQPWQGRLALAGKLPKARSTGGAPVPRALELTHQPVCCGRIARMLPRALATALVLVVSSLTYAAAGRLTVRVTDAGTGKPIPARLSLRAADGSYPGDRVRHS